MRNAIGCLTLLCVLLGLLAGCGTKSDGQTSSPVPAQTVPDAQISNLDPGTQAGSPDSSQTELDVQANTSVNAELSDGPQTPAKDGSVDVDLSVLSSTMVYAEVYNMMTDPGAYMGKTIRIKGQYNSSYFEDTKKYYFFVVISDATACCQQGIEFQWNGEHSYPEDYPEDGSEIEVTGVFGSYQELGQTYYYLAVDDMTRM
ncbi:MAG: hypothetical protein AB7E30_10295 [Lawsonibacter sp.]